jgi:hypothetical protein
VLLLWRHAILSLLPRRGPGLLRRPLLLLYRPGLLLCLSGCLRMPALPPPWLCVGGSRDAGKEEQYCHGDYEFHEGHLDLSPHLQQLLSHR